MSGPTHDRDTAVQTLCRDLKLPGVLRHYRNGIVPTDPKDYLRESLEAERTSRREKRLKNLLKGARLPYARTLSEYDFLRLPSLPKEQILSLAQGDFLRRRENLVLLGNSGTGGLGIRRPGTPGPGVRGSAAGRTPRSGPRSGRQRC